MNHVHCTEEVGTDTVHFVDKANTRNVIVISLTPYGFRLRFYTGNRVKYCNSTVKNTK